MSTALRRESGRGFVLAPLLLLLRLPALAAVEGIVTTPEGTPVEGARVELVATGASQLTGRQGRFTFPAAEPPASVRVEHPRFEVLEAEVGSDGGAGGDTVLALTAKHEVYEEIVVSASREGGGFQPVSIAASSVESDSKPAPVTNLVELVEGTPGFAESGQGGLFQAYSIRGVAGQRVMTLVAGARIVTERRAGPTASFLDPLLLGSAEVLRGPSTSYYGSGALGGVLQVFPQRREGLEASAGYSAEGDLRYQLVGWGGGGWSLSLAHRQAGDSETPDGQFLPSHFDQWSGALSKSWERPSGTVLEVLAIPTFGEDIGKPNTRFPGRITSYPYERHLLLKVSARRPGAWRLDLYAHPNSLDTLNLRSDSRSLVENRAVDFGVNAQRELDLGKGFSARVGLDYFGRQGVEATENVLDLVTGERTLATTLDGSEDEASAYGAVRRAFGRATVELGGRATWLRQDNREAEAVDDTAVSGFAGVTVPLAGGFELAANVGSGLRFPSLSERYFTGSTGRGGVVANADLDPERSVSADLGVRYYGHRLFAAVYAFRNEIDDYIEQVDLGNDVQTFVNLTSGTLEGFEGEGFYRLTDALRFTWAGQSVQGRAAAGGGPLADVSADRAEAGLRCDSGRWQALGRLQHRFRKDDPGPGEKAIGSAELFSASVGYRLREGLSLSLNGSNLLDEIFFPTADELAVPAQGRSVGVGLSWSR